MHSGLLIAVRTYLLRAKAWQQLLICVSVAVLGLALALAGHKAGVALVAFGMLLSLPAISALPQRERRTAAPDDSAANVFDDDPPH